MGYARTTCFRVPWQVGGEVFHGAIRWTRQERVSTESCKQLYGQPATRAVRIQDELCQRWKGCVLLDAFGWLEYLVVG